MHILSNHFYSFSCITDCPEHPEFLFDIVFNSDFSKYEVWFYLPDVGIKEFVFGTDTSLESGCYDLDSLYDFVCCYILDSYFLYSYVERFCDER